MATIFTADSRQQAGRGLSWLLALVVVLVSATALGHEIEHVAQQHDEPCGLHVAAEHLAMATTPEPVSPAVSGHVSSPWQPSRAAPPSPAAQPRSARAPPLRS